MYRKMCVKLLLGIKQQPIKVYLQLNSNVGRMLADGIGTKKDEYLARQYFEKAASRGDNRASFNLAMMEEQKKNYMGAYQWYELSTRDGMLDNKVISCCLKVKKTALAANLSQDQIRQARDRADKWISGTISADIYKKHLAGAFLLPAIHSNLFKIVPYLVLWLAYTHGFNRLVISRDFGACK